MTQEEEGRGDQQVRASQDSPARKKDDASSKKRKSEPARGSPELNGRASVDGSKKRKVEIADGSTTSGAPKVGYACKGGRTRGEWLRGREASEGLTGGYTS